MKIHGKNVLSMHSNIMAVFNHLVFHKTKGLTAQYKLLALTTASAETKQQSQYYLVGTLGFHGSKTLCQGRSGSLGTCSCRAWLRAPREDEANLGFACFGVSPS